MECLLVARAYPDQPDKLGNTPLWIAAYEGHEACVKRLIGSRAPVDKASERKTFQEKKRKTFFKI